MNQIDILKLADAAPEKKVRLAAVLCARAVLPAFERAFPNDRRPRESVLAALRFERITEKELFRAWSAACDARNDARRAWLTSVREGKDETGPIAAMEAAWAACFAALICPAVGLADAYLCAMRSLSSPQIESEEAEKRLDRYLRLLL